MLRQGVEQRHDKEHLARHRYDDGSFGLTDALEEITHHNRESHNREGQQDKPQTTSRLLDKSCGITRSVLAHKDSYHLVGEQFADDKSHNRSERGPADGHIESLAHAVVFACAVVVADNWLHTLRQTQHNHREDEGHTIHNAIGSDGRIAAILLQYIVDHDNHHAGADVNRKGGHSDTDDILDNLPTEAEDAVTESQKTAGRREMHNLNDEWHQLRNHSSPRRARYAPLESENKQSVERAIDGNRNEHHRHCFLGVTRHANYTVKP